MAKPKPYDPKVGDGVCEHLILGKSLRSFCRKKGSPSLSTVFRWLRESAEFRHQYACAREDQADTLADQLVDIADRANAQNAHAFRLRVDTRKWIMSKLKPRKYSEKIEIGGSVGLHDDREPPDLLEVSRSLLFILTAAEGQVAAQQVAKLPLLTAPTPVRQGEPAPSTEPPQRPAPEWFPPEDEPSGDSDRHLSIAAEKDEMQRGLPIHKNIRYRGRG